MKTKWLKSDNVELWTGGKKFRIYHLPKVQKKKATQGHGRRVVRGLEIGK